MKISSIAVALVMLLMVLTLNACGDGKSDSGGDQLINGQCAANQILNNGQCQTCPANQSVVGNQCVLQCAANQTIRNGQCVTLASQCIGNQILQSGSCIACLDAQVPNAARTMCIDNRSQCASNQIEQNGLCTTCPVGQFASNNRCTTPPAPPLNCGPNQIIQNNMCVDCAANEMVKNNRCVPIPVTCTATQIIVNNMCVDCPPGDVVQNNKCVTPVPNNDPPIVNAGADQSIQLPVNMVTLAGTATDDGNPVPPGLLIVGWADSGPGTVTYADPSNPATTATFSTFGTYTLTLTADDGNLISSDMVVVQVAVQNNNPPTVAPAASVVSITLPSPNTSSLSGNANDDGVPGPLSFQWSSNLGGVSFANASAENTTATFTQAGTAVLTFTANDGDMSASGTVAVVVNPAPPPMCGGVVLNPGEVCILACGSAGDVIFGDAVADTTGDRTAGNCPNAAAINGSHTGGSTIDPANNCSVCH